jgi:hypothetical protein
MNHYATFIDAERRAELRRRTDAFNLRCRIQIWRREPAVFASRFTQIFKQTYRGTHKQLIGTTSNQRYNLFVANSKKRLLQVVYTGKEPLNLKILHLSKMLENPSYQRDLILKYARELRSRVRIIAENLNLVLTLTQDLSTDYYEMYQLLSQKFSGLLYTARIMRMLLRRLQTDLHAIIYYTKARSSEILKKYSANLKLILGGLSFGKYHCFQKMYWHRVALYFAEALILAKHATPSHTLYDRLRLTILTTLKNSKPIMTESFLMICPSSTGHLNLASIYWTSHLTEPSMYVTGQRPSRPVYPVYSPPTRRLTLFSTLDAAMNSNRRCVGEVRSIMFVCHCGNCSEQYVPDCIEP